MQKYLLILAATLATLVAATAAPLPTIAQLWEEPFADIMPETGAGTLSFRFTLEGEGAAPALFPMDFAHWEAVCGCTLDRNATMLQARFTDGTMADVSCNLTAVTPERTRIDFAPLPGAVEYILTTPVLADGAAATPPRPHRLLGNGDAMMLPELVTSNPMARFWSYQLMDFFNNGTIAAVGGSWRDFVHIYPMLRPGTPPSFSEFQHYVARDSHDEPIGIDEHHGLAYSEVKAIDYDRDGRTDIFLGSFNRPVVRFIHNLSQTPTQMAFAEGKPVPSLPNGCRYAFGDLDGDNIPDAVQMWLVRKESTLNVLWRKGAPLNADGIPVFSKEATRIPVDVPDTSAMSISWAGQCPVPSLEDLNGDGLLDLSVLFPPYLYVLFNGGTAEVPRFGEPNRVMKTDGTPWDSDFYFPNFGWADINGDGLPDLLKGSGVYAWHSVGSVLTVEAKALPLNDCLQQRRLEEFTCGLASFEIADMDGDGVQEFCQIDSEMRLIRFALRDGCFHQLPSWPLEPKGTQRYGCPDPLEYASLYSQLRLFDFDGDGLLDVLANNEHNWRCGYYSLYLNRGDGHFSSEVRLTPTVDNRHWVPRPLPGDAGEGFLVNDSIPLDFLMVKADGALLAEGGSIHFTFSPESDTVPEYGRVFFHTGFWNAGKMVREELGDLYKTSRDLEEVLQRVPAFALAQLPDGRLLCQLGSAAIRSEAPVRLSPEKVHDVRVAWDGNSTTVTLDGAVVANGTCGPAGGFGDFVHIGSLGWHAVQHWREYPGRRAFTAIDLALPANGLFGCFEFADAHGTTLRRFAVDSPGELLPRTTPGYRCVPGIMSYGDGYALVLHTKRAERFVEPGQGAALTLVPFTRHVGEAPSFGEAVELQNAEGRPFQVNLRTQVIPTDWNQDGHIDMLLSTENHRENPPFNDAVQVYLNDGAGRFALADDAELARLKKELMPHHDIKLYATQVPGIAGELFFCWTDTGLRAFSREYLRSKPANVVIQGIALP